MGSALRHPFFSFHLLLTFAPLREIFLRFNRRTRGLKFSCMPWSAENILAETILVGGGNANESIDT